MKKIHGMLRPAKNTLVIVLVFALFFMSATIGMAKVEKIPQTSVSAPSASTPPVSAAPAGAVAIPVRSPSLAIPEAEIATKATDLSGQLDTMVTNLAPSLKIRQVQAAIPELTKNSDRDLANTIRVIREQPTLVTIQSELKLWQARETLLNTWMDLITERAILLHNSLDRLAILHETWVQTHDAVLASKVPHATLQQTSRSIESIAKVEKPIQVELNKLLDLQARVAAVLSQCKDAMDQITQAQKTAMKGVMTRDIAPIWSSNLLDRANAEMPGRLREFASAYWADIREYVSDPSKGMPFHLAIFAGLAILFTAIRRKVDLWAAQEKEPIPGERVFDQPYTASLLCSFLIATGANSPAPVLVIGLFNILLFVPILRLVKPVIDRRMIPWLYVLWGLYLIETLPQAFINAPLIEQMILLVISCIGITTLGWVLFLGKLRVIPAKTTELSWMFVLKTAAVLALLGFFIGLMATIVGNISLARLTTPLTLLAGIAGFTYYAFLLVVSGTVSFSLHVWPLNLLKAVQHNVDFLERRSYHVLAFLVIVGWVARLLNYGGLMKPAQSLLQAILDAKLEKGFLHVSLGDILAFIIAVWASYLISSFIRFILQEDIYPRMRISPGASHASSILLNYMIIALGFIVGLAMLGVDLNKVSILAGAFGVGIGFGLQGVVNNFVSGLILLFERPIHVGDVIEIGGSEGVVTNVGIRATIVRTWNEAELIVPNSQLVSEKVTNWTLSDRMRRIELPVRLNYGAEPQKVIELLESVALSDQRILKYPPPKAVFREYGDSSINFMLWVWTDNFDNWSQIRSDLAAAVYDAVYKAGMSFPFPQRAVHMMNPPRD